MKNILIISMITLFFSCNDDDSPSSTAIDTGIGIKVLNSSGEDLLNTNTTNHFNGDNIRLFQLINGEITLIYNPNMDLPYGYSIETDTEGNNIVNAGFLPDASHEHPEYIVKWSDTEQDTLKCEVEQFSNVLRFSKVWVNEELQWESSSQTERIVTVVID